LRPEGLYDTRPAQGGNKAAKLKAIREALRTATRVWLATDCDREGQLIGQEILEHYGYRASACSSGAAGLRRVLESEDIDLVFCDLMMKGVSGMELHAQLLEQDPALLHKIVFMTGGACSPSARQFVLDHPAVVVEKPFDLIAETDRRLAPVSSSGGALH